jgi:hypothetical protein
MVHFALEHTYSLSLLKSLSLSRTLSLARSSHRLALPSISPVAPAPAAFPPSLSLSQPCTITLCCACRACGTWILCEMALVGMWM